ncbi:hypothetical protein ACLB2K_046825 [Fragaria x ananassa]
MGKKRKSITTSLDEVDRSMYASFCSAANSLSQLYTQGMNNQKFSFQAGERHALDKIYQWIRSTQQGGSRVTTDDVLSYLQNELGYCGEEAPQSMCPIDWPATSFPAGLKLWTENTMIDQGWPENLSPASPGRREAVLEACAVVREGEKPSPA